MRCGKALYYFQSAGVVKATESNKNGCMLGCVHHASVHACMDAYIHACMYACMDACMIHEWMHP